MKCNAMQCNAMQCNAMLPPGCRKFKLDDYRSLYYFDCLCTSASVSQVSTGGEASSGKCPSSCDSSLVSIYTGP